MSETEAEQHIDTLRSELDVIQANITALEPYISKSDLRKGLTLWRECITIAKKHYPKPPTLFTEMVRFDVNSLLSMLITHPASHLDLQNYIQRFKDLLYYPQAYFDNYDDMFPSVDDEGNRMLSLIGYRDFLLKEAHKEHSVVIGRPQDIDEQPNVDMSSKKFKRDYDKYVKEWKEKWLK